MLNVNLHLTLAKNNQVILINLSNINIKLEEETVTLPAVIDVIKSLLNII